MVVFLFADAEPRVHGFDVGPGGVARLDEVTANSGETVGQGATSLS